jgi:hypothetical protein
MRYLGLPHLAFLVVQARDVDDRVRAEAVRVELERPEFGQTWRHLHPDAPVVARASEPALALHLGNLEGPGGEVPPCREFAELVLGEVVREENTIPGDVVELGRDGGDLPSIRGG